MLGRDQDRSAGKQISDLHSKDYRFGPYCRRSVSQVRACSWRVLWFDSHLENSQEIHLILFLSSAVHTGHSELLSFRTVNAMFYLGW